MHAFDTKPYNIILFITQLDKATVGFVLDSFLQGKMFRNY